jgi:hypothetical protein
MCSRRIARAWQPQRDRCLSFRHRYENSSRIGTHLTMMTPGNFILGRVYEQVDQDHRVSVVGVGVSDGDAELHGKRKSCGSKHQRSGTSDTVGDCKHQWSGTSDSVEQHQRPGTAYTLGSIASAR